MIRASAALRRAIRRLVCDEGGQDLIEYALLAGFIGVAGYLVLGALSGDIFNAYDSWIDPSTGTPTLWDPPDPATSSGGGS